MDEIKKDDISWWPLLICFVVLLCVLAIFIVPSYIATNTLKEQTKITEGKMLYEKDNSLRGLISVDSGSNTTVFGKVNVAFRGTEISWERYMTVSYHSDTPSWLRIIDPIDSGTMIPIASKIVLNNTYPAGDVSETIKMNECTGEIIIMEDINNAYRFETWNTDMCG